MDVYVYVYVVLFVFFIGLISYCGGKESSTKKKKEKKMVPQKRLSATIRFVDEADG